MPGGGKGGKGGGGEIKVTGDAAKPVSFDLAGGLTTTTEMGGTGTPLATRTEMGGTGTPLETGIAVTLSVPEPLRTETQGRTELAVTQPIETSSDMRLDVKPVVVDLCLTAGIGPVPRISITRPYDHHVSVRVLGTELFGLDLHGERRTVVDHLPAREATVWESVSPTPARPRPHPASTVGLAGADGPSRAHPRSGSSSDGIRIRLGD